MTIDKGCDDKVLISIKTLMKLEWLTDEFTGCTMGRCKICGGYKYDCDLKDGEFVGHSPDCELGRVLDEYRRKVKNNKKRKSEREK